MSEQAPQSDTVLVAMDGSPSAQMAAGVAIQIAQSKNQLVRGIYVVDETIILDMYLDYAAELGRRDEPSSRAELVQWFEARGECALDWLKEQCASAGVTVTTELLFGGIPELVSREAADAGLVVLGRRGHSHASDHQHLGSNFRAIVHHTPEPVLIGGDHQSELRCILLAYADGERARDSLRWIAELQRAKSSQVIVFHATSNNGTSDQELSDMRAQVAASGLVDFSFASSEGQPAAEIVRMAAENQVDLIAMGCYHHSALVDWLVGSTVDRVLRETDLPVLVV